MANKKIDKIKSSVFSRGMSLAKLSLSAGAQMAGQSLANIGRTPEERQQVWKDFFKKQTALFADEVGMLKGSLLKAGQLLSVYGEHFFPPEVTEILRSLHSESVPVTWRAMENLLEERLGDRVYELDIEEEAFAAASLGQVHLATVRATGERIALKIQYPNVERAIDSDLRLVKLFLNSSRLLPSDFKLEPLFEEIRDVLQQESDYTREATLMDRYRELLAGDPRFVIPRVLERYSGPRLLATSFEPSVRADAPELKEWPQERRNGLSRNFLELFFNELFKWHFIQTDAHTGNFGFRLGATPADDRIVLYDFGATRAYESDFMSQYTGLIATSVKEDWRTFNEIAQRMKFLFPDDPQELIQLFEDIFKISVEPFHDTVYDWAASDLPQRSVEMTMTIIKKYPLRPPPRQLIFINRKTAGVFTILSLLGAKMNTRDLMARFI